GKSWSGSTRVIPGWHRPAMPRARTRRRGKGSPWKGTIRTIVVFGLLLAVNAYFFAFRRGTSLRDLRELSAGQKAVALSPAGGGAAGGGGGGGRAVGVGGGPAAGGGAPRGGRPPGLGQPRLRDPLTSESSDGGRRARGAVAGGDPLPALPARAGVPAGTASA